MAICKHKWQMLGIETKEKNKKYYSHGEEDECCSEPCNIYWCKVCGSYKYAVVPEELSTVFEPKRNK